MDDINLILQQNLKLEKIDPKSKSSYYSPRVIDALIKQYHKNNQDLKLFEVFFYLNFFDGWKNVDFTNIIDTKLPKINKVYETFSNLWQRSIQLSSLGNIPIPFFYKKYI
eukprot:Anaeramoba_flamelloidesc31139_g1_i1.p1 GENE.c31139_g1_i1~~c31139_g1_i1.p1  ORF type:complete len:110 (+),score=21.52 c31139_g1_i1:232-561(+)